MGHDPSTASVFSSRPFPYNWQWLAVRCCCTPMKIFGFMRLPITNDQRMIVRDMFGTEHQLRIETISQSGGPYCGRVSSAPLDLEDYSAPAYRSESERAIYSEDRPIEFWRNFREFMEVKS